MNKILPLLGLLFTCFLLPAQEGKDFILTLQKDRLYGKIKFDPMRNVIKFYYDNAKVTFTPETINEFGLYRDGVTKFYQVITNDWKDKVFVEVLSKGKLNLYHYNTSGNELYDLISDAGYRYYLGKTDETLIRMSPRSYQHVLNIVIKENTSLLTQKIRFEDVPKIIQAYNK